MTQNIFPRSTPEAQGVSSAAILSFIDAAAEQGELHSVMLVRHTHVVAEGWWSPYGPDTVQLLYSLSKSFASTAVGLAVAEGRLSVDDPVLAFFPDEAPTEPGEHLAATRVRHLLSMSTGHLDDTAQRVAGLGDDWVRGFLSLPPEQAPGTQFTYNNGATFMLSAILQKLTGVGLLEYLRPRLLGPLGITQAYWERSPQGIDLGFSGLHLTTEAVARFGQLYLQRGRWQGRQLLPEAWVDEATTLHIPTTPPPEANVVDWAQGYGYQFWRCRHGAYRADGAFGQFCVVMPEQDAVLVLTGAVETMQAVLELVWSQLLPAMQGAPLPEGSASQGVLEDRLASLNIPPVKGEPATPVADVVSGRTYHFGTNEGEGTADERARVQEAALHRHGDGWHLTLRSDGQDHQLECGYSTWTPGTTTFSSRPAQVRVSGAWTAEDTFTFRIYYLETPHCLTVSCRFSEDRVQVEMSWNVQFGPVNLPPFEGRAS